MGKLREILKDLWYFGNRHDREIDVAQAESDIKSLIKSIVPEEKRNGIKYTNTWYERRGFNACREEILKRLERL